MILVVDSTAAHARELSKSLREKDKLEAFRIGLDPNKAVFQAYKRAVYRKTALVDGKVAAMWGVVGTLLSMQGMPYFLTGTEADKVSPIQFTRLYIKESKEMNKLFPILQNLVDASYTGAVRLLEIAGFKLEGPITLNDSEFYKFTMSNV